MYRIILIALVLLASHVTYAQECVILLHGLARSATSMSSIEKALTKANYKVVNQGYDSRSDNIQTLSMAAVPKAIEACDSSSPINFVTHSMGGILVRYYLLQHNIANLGRVVMLGPPNKGSQVVDKMRHVLGFEFINGPAGMQLGTGKMSMPNVIGAAHFDLGIIAGTRSINPILSTQLPNPDDGKVSVENTKLDGMDDHISLPVTHTFMMRNKAVIKQVVHFLQSGKFEHQE